MLTIRRLTQEHIEPYLSHLSRHFGERGHGGLHAHAHSLYEPLNTSLLRPRILSRWSTEPGAGTWEMNWGLWLEDQIVGHLELNGTNKPVNQHRARLGMGIEEPYRRKGYGSQMMSVALDWAQKMEFIHWIDISVFSHNLAAIELYKKFGFNRIGVVPDCLRIDGLSIEDTQLALCLDDLKIKTLPQRPAMPSHLDTLQYIEMNTKTEKLSFSAILTEHLQFKDLFVHHEIIPPGRRSSSPHYHTHIEEMFLVLDGQPQVFYGDQIFELKPGSFIGFLPNDPKLHYIYNPTNLPVKILGICSDHPLDQIIYAH